MKKHAILLVMCVTLLSQSFAQSISVDTTTKYYNSLLKSGKPTDKVLLGNKLDSLLLTNKEKNWVLAQEFYYNLNTIAKADSIKKAGKIKFPIGEWARFDEANVIYTEQDAAKKEVLFKAWFKKFASEKMYNTTDRIQYDYARNAVAVAYAKEGNANKAIEYADMLETKVWRGEGYAIIGNVFVKNEKYETAAILLKKAVENAHEVMVSTQNDRGAGFAKVGYPNYCNSYAFVLYKLNNYAEALKYVQQAYENTSIIKGDINANYAKILMALGKNQEAFDKINEAVKEGQATKDMKDDLKSLYVKVKGSDTGYDDYVASLNKILTEKTQKQVAKAMINKPAPDFTLSDVDGKSVSLKDLRGKVVIVDFWATWCGPCKKSMPAMKMAVEKYKSDPNVKFLFIHTWEHGDANATQNAKKFVTDNNYPFHVLMDLQNPISHINKTVQDFKVEAIPSKFIIDKDGNIRFKFTGFSGGDDAAVEEVSAMIELARKGGA